MKMYSNAVYPLGLIEQAAFDYRSVGRIEMHTDNGITFCSFESEKVSAEVMANEFDNYLIELLNSGAGHDLM